MSNSRKAKAASSIAETAQNPLLLSGFQNLILGFDEIKEKFSP